MFGAQADQAKPSTQKPPVDSPSAAAPKPATPRPKADSDNRIVSETGFTIDYPKKDWQPPLFGTGSSLLVLHHKSREVTVAVEATRVVNALTAKEINDLAAKLEIEDWMARRPLATGFSHQFFDHEGERSIITDFTQPGPRGPETVRMYTMPRGRDWFRVICTTTPPTQDKYRQTCHKIALSLVPAPR
jgi:hypothetical protein